MINYYYVKCLSYLFIKPPVVLQRSDENKSSVVLQRSDENNI